MKDIIYIISDIEKALAFEWIAENIDPSKFRLSFILLNPGPSVLEDFLLARKFPVYRVRCRGKSDWPSALFKMCRLLMKLKPQTVHCHLLQANIIGLTAAWMTGIRERIYTRHHSSLHHSYHRKGIMWDKLANTLATKIVAISGIVKEILLQWEGAEPAKIVLIPHGFKLESFRSVEPERVADFRQRHRLKPDSRIVGVISRFTEWKGVQYIIPAFVALYRKCPEAVLILLNAGGDYEDHILKLLKELPDDAYRLISFEQDIASAYHSMDIFVHTPIDAHSEAFGQIYVEALAVGVPSIFTLSGISAEFIEHEVNALVTPFMDSEAIYLAMVRLLEDHALSDDLKSNGWNSVKDKFALQTMIGKLETLYAE